MSGWATARRKSFALGEFEPFSFDVDGERFTFIDCWRAGEISNMAAHIHDSVLKTTDGRYIRLTVVAAVDDPQANGIKQGWYVAFFISKAEADRYIDSWGVLREQPGEPPSGSPWS